MALRQRVREAKASASQHFRKPQPDELTFWCVRTREHAVSLSHSFVPYTLAHARFSSAMLLAWVADRRLCEGMKKRSVRGKKSASLEAALHDWDMLAILESPDVHFLNEATGVGTRLHSLPALRTVSDTWEHTSDSVCVWRDGVCAYSGVERRRDGQLYLRTRRRAHLLERGAWRTAEQILDARP